MSKDEMINKTGLITGSIVGVVLLLYHLVLMLPHSRQDFFSSIGGWIMITGVLIGGALSGFIIENYFIQRLIHIGSIWGCIVGSIIISPLSLYLSIIFSTICGGMGEKVGGKLGYGILGSHIGIFFGIIIFIMLVESIGALIGMGLGFLVQSLIRRLHI